MKNVCLTFLFALSCLVLAKAEGVPCVPAEDIKITITIEIGMKPECSWAFSLCRITVGGSGLTANGESFPSGGGGGGSWKMYIPRESFAKYYPAFLSRLDGKTTVTFEGSYLIPEDLRKALGATHELNIEANVPYPLKFENGQYVITFPL
jgi:hypothetical protein